MKPAEYLKASRRLIQLARRIRATADASTPRQKAARTRVVNLLAQEARRLFERNSAESAQGYSPSSVLAGGGDTRGTTPRPAVGGLVKSVAPIDAGRWLAMDAVLWSGEHMVFVETVLKGVILMGEDSFRGTAAAGGVSRTPALKLGPQLFQFASFNGWVNSAQRAWKERGVRSDDTLCIDAQGRVCSIGRDFMIARDEGAFPVSVFLKRGDVPEYAHFSEAA